MRRVVAVAVALLAWSAGAMGLLDPGLTTGVPPVDADGPPAALASQALAQTEARPHVATVAFGNATALRTVRRNRVDPVAGRVWSRLLQYDPTYEGFGTAHVGWYRPGDRHGFGSWRRSSFSGLGSVFDEGALRGAAATVVAANDSTVVVRVTDDVAAYAAVRGGDGAASEVRADNVSATLTVVVDRAAGAPRRVAYRATRDGPDGRQTHRIVWTLRRWDQVRVERPTWVPYDLYELFEEVSDVR